MQVSEARKEVRDRHYEAEVERSAIGELQANAEVMSIDYATQLRAADALRAAIKQLTAASVVLAHARTLEDTAASRNVTTHTLQQQTSVAKVKARAFQLPAFTSPLPPGAEITLSVCLYISECMLVQEVMVDLI